jgi:hypothetical protein
MCVGIRAIVAESLALKHQLLISNRSRHRTPNLTCRSRKPVVTLELAARFSATGRRFRDTV